MTEMLSDEDRREGVLAQDVRQGRRRAGRRLQPRRQPCLAGEGARAPAHAPRPGPPDAASIDSWIDDPRRQHRDDQDRQDRARPGLEHRPADDRRRGARHVAWPDQATAVVDTDVSPNQGVTAGSERDLERRPAGPAGRGRGARRAARARRRRSSASPVADLTVNKGVVSSGGGKSVTYGALLGDKLLLGVPNTGQARREGGRASTRSSASALHRDRHPGQGGRASTPTSTTSGCRGCCTAGSSGRAARAPYGNRARRSRVDESSIKHIPGARVVRKGDFLGVVGAGRVRRDPGRRAAEGQVGRAGDDARERQPLEDDPGDAAASAERYAENSGNIANAHGRRRTCVAQSYSIGYQSPRLVRAVVRGSRT